VAFAARCARRVLPLFMKGWPEATALHTAALESAVGLVESSAAAAAIIAVDLVEAGAAANAARFAAWTAMAAHADADDDASDTTKTGHSDFDFSDARRAAVVAALAAGDAIAAAVAAGGGSFINVVSNVASAVNHAVIYSDPYDGTFGISRDFVLLLDRARREGWTDDTPVPPTVFGPLWPDGGAEGGPQGGADPPKPNPEVTSIAQTASERSMSQPFEAHAPVFGAPGAPWNLVHRLGIGGFGQVWLAKNADSDEYRAVKFFTHEVRRTQHAQHEMRVVRHVLKHMREHPESLANIVPLLDANLDTDPPWLMYRFVPGGQCFADVIRAVRDPSAATRLAAGVPLLRTVAEAVGRLHRLGIPIVHRDLKPSNVLMDGNTPMISDFGIGGASVIGNISDSTGGHTRMAADVDLFTHVRKSHTLVYASRQQLAGELPDPRDDVHALAVIAFQLAVGDFGASPGADTRDLLEDLEVGRLLAGVITQNLSSIPSRRQADAGHMADSLGQWVSERA